ncbi:alpha/beta fold hydrolase [Streptomyces milbemycinicus]|uniref:alpha/beta fold hydrolase n=1 Tax=Streptomyces milbemycinicus TaxID=476552 RepID=UPI001FE5FBAC|nr:alpha/beta hydrolase [Streptomyces milbemycinicus]
MADVTSIPSDAELARSLDGDFDSRHAEVNGIDLHYVIGGQGDPLFLLGGWPQTWWQFHKIMPTLARRHQVIAVDLRGMGSSGKPEAGYDKRTMAGDILALAHLLGHARVDIAGHDIGATVAYSFAANHPEAAGRIALLDVLHPEESWFKFSVLPRPGQFVAWWFAFNQLRGLPEKLLEGRSRHLVDAMLDLLVADPTAISDFDRAVYAQAYSTPEAIRASNGWYQAFAQDIEDEKGYGFLTPPILALTSPHTYEPARTTLARTAPDAKVVKVDGSGHFLAEEQPDAVAQHLTAFFTR